MNCIYKSETVTIHDDRELLTIDQAVDILWNGGSIRAEYPPDFSVDPPEFDSGVIFENKDLVPFEVLESYSISKDKKKAMLAEALRGYDLYEEIV